MINAIGRSVIHPQQNTAKKKNLQIIAFHDIITITERLNFVIASLVSLMNKFPRYYISRLVISFHWIPLHVNSREVVVGSVISDFMEYLMFKWLVKFIHKSLRRRGFHVESQSENWNILSSVFWNICILFSQRAVLVCTILKQFSVFFLMLSIWPFPIVLKVRQVFSYRVLSLLYWCTFFKGCKWIVFPENKCILDGISNTLM